MVLRYPCVPPLFFRSALLVATPGDGGVGGATVNVAVRQCTSGCARRWCHVADGVRRAGGLTHAVGALCCLSDNIVRAVHCRASKNGANTMKQGCNICANLLYPRERRDYACGEAMILGRVIQPTIPDNTRERVRCRNVYSLLTRS